MLQHPLQTLPRAAQAVKRGGLLGPTGAPEPAPTPGLSAADAKARPEHAHPIQCCEAACVHVCMHACGRHAA